MHLDQHFEAPNNLAVPGPFNCRVAQPGFSQTMPQVWPTKVEPEVLQLEVPILAIVLHKVDSFGWKNITLNLYKGMHISPICITSKSHTEHESFIVI